MTFAAALAWGAAAAQGEPPADAPVDVAALPEYVTTVRAEDDASVAGVDGRATSVVRKSELEQRLPRSTPDALRYEPGVFVQQTAHSQGSPFVRGLTGQQTLILFDGIRLNNSTFRQGPNQYFFTLDSATIEEIAVIRGGASTRYGSDALGGVILTRPIEPLTREGWSVHPALALRGATADLERGGRVQVGATAPGDVSILAGAGARRVGLLRSGGPIRSPADGSVPDVPRFAEDGRTQLGTGFDEVTGDVRAVWRPAPAHTVTAAAYVYRQYDAPRTDQCPPAFARFDECLEYDEQFRTLAYAAWDAEPELPWAQRARVTVSYQQQHELRTGERPASFVVNRGTDDVHTFGVSAAAQTATFDSAVGPLEVGYGADTYFDRVASQAEIAFTDIDVVVPRSRGQYLDGATYLYGGAFAHAGAQVAEQVRLRGGGRLSWAVANAPEDAASGSQRVDRAWVPLVGFMGAEWTPLRQLSLLLNVDRSFRAPNLDDLTSRQQTGPGFQFENAALDPEQATTLELGAQVRTPPLSVDAWVFQSLIEGAIARRPLPASACPPNTPQCGASWSRFQLVNAEGLSVVRGVEAAVRARLPYKVGASASVTWTWGEGELTSGQRVPLSRIPPLNGTAELTWLSTFGFGAGAGVRWAGTQDRLAVSDLSDARIPLGGTPGFVVFDLRAWYQLGSRARIGVVAENLFDVPYRYHGSSVNGPGRGVIAALEVSP